MVVTKKSKGGKEAILLFVLKSKKKCIFFIKNGRRRAGKGREKEKGGDRSGGEMKSQEGQAATQAGVH